MNSHHELRTTKVLPFQRCPGGSDVFGSAATANSGTSCLLCAGEFTSFAGGFGPDIADHTQIVVTSSNAGSVRISNSAFWGPSNQIAKINGTGTVAFDSCIFNAWDAIKQNRSAIQVSCSLAAGDDLFPQNAMVSQLPHVCQLAVHWAQL